MYSRYVITLAILAFAITACNMPEESKEELEKKADEIVKRYAEDMLLVKGGTFVMGYQDESYGVFVPDQYDAPQHEVTINDFYLSRYEATEGDFYVFAKLNNLSLHEWNNNLSIESRSPVSHVSWNDSHKFCTWLAQRSSLPYRLPTEAEWEYAARSRGQDVKHATNDGTWKVGVNIAGNEGISPPEIDKYPHNPLGIYGMADGVREYVYDWYAKDYFLNSPQNNPTGPETGNEKVIRGRRYHQTLSDDFENPMYARNAYPVDYRGMYNGFRCAQSIK